MWFDMILAKTVASVQTDEIKNILVQVDKADKQNVHIP